MPPAVVPGLVINIADIVGSQDRLSAVAGVHEDRSALAGAGWDVRPCIQLAAAR